MIGLVNVALWFQRKLFPSSTIELVAAPCATDVDVSAVKVKANVPTKTKGILFLCVANSARSQMAEGLAPGVGE